MFPPTFNPNLLVLPFKAFLHDSGQVLTFSQTTALLAGGKAALVCIERSQPGAPEMIGWTLFEHISQTQLYAGKALFETERAARQHIRCVYHN